MFDTTQPIRRLDDLQPLRKIQVLKRKPIYLRKRVWVATFIFLYFFAPLRTNILLLGTDDSPERGTVGRTDTMILTTVVPLRPYIGMLSIPRDLWVTIPNVGEQRINTQALNFVRDRSASDDFTGYVWKVTNEVSMI